MEPREGNLCGWCPERIVQVECDTCKVIKYCSAWCQTMDEPRHRKDCHRIKVTREKMEAEEGALRAHPGNFLMPANVFETAVGRFGELPGTAAYMSAKLEAALALSEVRTRTAV
ncbi:hypothetical protein QBC34DRAFT_440126 [Podospora aff. communis PSN243]|uniref:MYND-type domain-containing protein n=1 Tax=Podospora aff. communis PSN243 TaxID=3040156 RepID=A0AAV9GHG8_9PEZI|nr:hypothetical protein QBC34DRAFT_440126 [Podospora aff. communis PSN243]